jgi:glycosyltransferase involved in cell wall biosynthesis
MTAKTRTRTSTALPAVIVVAIQQDVGADGGTTSLGEIITRFRRFRPIVVADRESPRLEDWRANGIEVHVVPQTASIGFFRNPFGTVASYLRYWRALGRLISSTGTKVLHANDPMALQLALPAVVTARAAVALNLRDTIDPERDLPRRRYRALFKLVDHVLYLSRDMADRWERIAPNARRACSVTYSVVNPSRFAASPISLHDPKVVLLSGLIRPKKGQLDFLRHVAPALAAKGISTWLAGDFNPSADPYMAACAKAAAPLGDAVRFLGYRADIPELMKRSSVVAVASRHEGLVRAMIEAMSCARPVVSFDVCSAREMLEIESGGAGKVVAAGDYEGMTNAIIEYCFNPALAAEAGTRGRKTASRLFAPDKVVERYEAVYEALSAAEDARP